MREAVRAQVPEATAATETGLRGWLFSAAQNSTGAFSAWVDLSEQCRAYDYAEITGYALTYIAGLALLAAQEESVGQAAAEWLVNRIDVGRLAARDGWDADAVYLFDLGMISSGLQSFGRRVGEARYAKAGERLAGFIAGELSRPTISAIASGSSSSRGGWSVHGIAHLSKLVQSQLLAGREPQALVEAVKAKQRDDGSFDVGDSCVMLHPHLYAAEGLWMWGTATGDSDALERATAAVEYAWTFQLESGGLPRSDEPDAPEQLDLTSQAIRLAVVLDLGVPYAAITRLCDVAIADGDGGVALPYQPDSQHVHLNTWVTLFAAQALALAAPGASPLEWHQLV